MAKKSHRTHSKKSRKGTRRHGRRRTLRGGYSTPAPVQGNPMAQMGLQNLAQGQQFARMHVQQHGGAGLDAGPYPGSVISPSMLPDGLHASARVAPLDAAISQISGLRDQDGGARRRKGRKGSKSRKGRKGSKKTCKGRKGHRGGAYSLDTAAPFPGSGMLLSPSMEMKALSGMSAEWKLAENPDAFAPGVRR